MRLLNEPCHTDGRRAPILVILLPGALQQPEDLVAAGFVSAVRHRGLAVDLILADLGIQYIGETTSGEALARLHEHVVRPAREAGYPSIWLAGISIGGFMAMAHAARYPESVQGLCLLSPYPGNRMLTREIAAAGGPASWQGRADGDGEREVWEWLRHRRFQAGAPCMYLAYGKEDRFADGLALMATAVDAAAVNTIAGGHDWPTWRQLWDNFLDYPPETFKKNKGNAP